MKLYRWTQPVEAVNNQRQKWYDGGRGGEFKRNQADCRRGKFYTRADGADEPGSILDIRAVAV